MAFALLVTGNASVPRLLAVIAGMEKQLCVAVSSDYIYKSQFRTFIKSMVLANRSIVG